MNPLPTTRSAWLAEIRIALLDAIEAIPFGSLVGTPLGAADLFHFGPVTALKCRGIRATSRVLRKASEGALASYVATTDVEHGRALAPPVAFALTYLAAHFALDLVTEGEVAKLMNYIERHPRTITPSRGIVPARSRSSSSSPDVVIAQVPDTSRTRPLPRRSPPARTRSRNSAT